MAILPNYLKQLALILIRQTIGMRKYNKRLLITVGSILLLAVSSFVSTLYVGSNKKSAVSERMSDHYKTFSTLSSDILFVGDDVTAEAPLYDMFPNIHLRNRGISGDLSREILIRSPELAKNKPEIIFLNFGANDLKARVPLSQVIANYREVISLFNSLSPESQIVISATLPLNEFSKTAVLSLNKELKKIAEKRQLVFINLPELLHNEEGYFITGMSDKNMRLLGPAYQLWQQEINTLVFSDLDANARENL